MTRGPWLVVALLWAGCTCRPPLTSIEAGFKAAPESLDFGRVLEGTEVERSVTLLAESRASLVIEASTMSPFSVGEAVEIPGGGEVAVRVTFQAGDGVATGTVTFRSEGKRVEVALRGEGVRPPTCTPSGPCKRSSFVLEESRCVETDLPENSECDVGSQCLEQGRCRAGECQGIARLCDDGDACTADFCSMEAGCDTTPRTCPAPANPCFVATCDAVTGCGSEQVPDLTPCGAADCVSVQVCISGQCQAVATPDGAPCGPPLACLGPGFCRQQRCERDAGEWLPDFTATLGVTIAPEAPGFLAAPGGLFFVGCGVPVPLDGGLDGDGGVIDAGVTSSCALVSYTRGGFERFTVPFDDGRWRQLVHATGQSVAALDDGGLELYGATTGVRRAVLPGVLGGARAVAALSNDEVVALRSVDGGVEVALANDGGQVAFIEGVVAEPLLAVDELDVVSVWDGPAGLFWRSDGGVTSLDAGPSMFAVTAGRWAAGGHLVHVFDGGLSTAAAPFFDDAGVPLEVLPPRPLLLTGTTGVVVYRRCPVLVMSCVEADRVFAVRTFDATTGALLHDRAVEVPGRAVHLDDTALVAQFTGAVVTLQRAEVDAGQPNAFVHLALDGREAVRCPLGVPVDNTRGAAFSGNRLFVLDQRSDGGAVLLGYLLGGLSTETSGWPHPDGVAGTRRAGP